MKKDIYHLGACRTHVCGQVEQLAEGQRVVLAGWVERVRELGGLNFIDLMDRYGSVQCVCDGGVSVADVSRYDVVVVKGVVRARPEEARRSGKSPNEVQAQSLEVLSRTRPLPLSVDEGKATEQTRLKYRYLDLRKPLMWRRLERRSDLMQVTRAFFAKRDFLEIETPFLYKSTPEGARDFLVPSRQFQGQFYALPQSPQILKQLLMIGGLDRYMQIVRCFRDEDLRQNRQPEFTQLDLECAFVNQDDIMFLMDDYFGALFRHIGKKLPSDDIPRISHAEALSLYGSDRPDLRYPALKFVTVKTIFQKFGFAPLASALQDKASDVAALPIADVFLKTPPSRGQLEKIEAAVRAAGAPGLIWLARGPDGIRSNAKKFLTPDLTAALDEVCARAPCMFVVAGGRKRFDWMHALRTAAIEQFKIAPAHEFAACWVTRFPLFTLTDEETLTYSHHPFTAPASHEIERLMTRELSRDELLDVEAAAYDIVINGEEIGGGSMRIHDPALQRRVLELLEMAPETIDDKFGFMIEALGYGAPPHGGIALGFDRLVAILDGHDVIRDYIAFPKTQSGQCLMSGAPSSVDAGQLEELGVKCVPHE